MKKMRRIKFLFHCAHKALLRSDKTLCQNNNRKVNYFFPLPNEEFLLFNFYYLNLLLSCFSDFLFHFILLLLKCKAREAVSCWFWAAFFGSFLKRWTLYIFENFQYFWHFFIFFKKRNFQTKIYLIFITQLTNIKSFQTSHPSFIISLS